MKAVRWEKALQAVRRIGPYVLVEVLLPGGTLLALFLWLSNCVGRGHFADMQQVEIDPVVLEHVVAFPVFRKATSAPFDARK